MEPISEVSASSAPSARSAFTATATDIEAIARRRGWLPDAIQEGLGENVAEARLQWMADAAQLLSPQVNEMPGLERLLERVFEYNAAPLVARAENQAVLSREGARDVLRELATRILGAPAVDSNRLKEIIAELKEVTGRRGPELFHPLRLALAGCAGEGENDRVILLLDNAARLPWAVVVKGCRQRILEFCAVLD